MSDHRIAVFLGPSCPLEQARKCLPNADYHPPAARGSFYNIVNDGYAIIVLVDGLFYGSLSVWHKEILYAIDCGIEVIGASSMGALRAAELQGTGMTGIGTIFGWYRDGLIDGDDEVALLHEAAESDYRALTIPLVNLRWNMIGAADRGLITEDQGRAIIDRAKQLCFTERTLEKILEPWKQSFDTGPLNRWLAGEADDLKRIDAIRAIEQAASREPEEAASVIPALRPYELVHMSVGIEYYKNERLTSIRAKRDGRARPLIDYVRNISPADPAYLGFVKARTYQRLIVGWARELHLDRLGGEEYFDTSLNWRPEAIGPKQRQATGLTLVDLARERRDEGLRRSLEKRFCTTESADIIAALDRRLKRDCPTQEESINWKRIIELNGRLVYTLWCLGLKKNIAETPKENECRHGEDEPGGTFNARVEQILRFADWIDRMGPGYFGYSLEAESEILLAHQYLDCLDRIGSGDWG